MIEKAEIFLTENDTFHIGSVFLFKKLAEKYSIKFGHCGV